MSQSDVNFPPFKRAKNENKQIEICNSGDDFVSIEPSMKRSKTEDEQSSLVSLPTEIIVMIYSNLHFIDQLRMRGVNRRMNEIGSTFKYSIDDLFFTNSSSTGRRLRTPLVGRFKVSIDGSRLIYLNEKKMESFLSAMRRISQNTVVRKMRIIDCVSFPSEVRNFLCETAADELVLEIIEGVFERWEQCSFLMSLVEKKERAIIPRGVVRPFEKEQFLNLHDKMLHRSISLMYIDVPVHGVRVINELLSQFMGVELSIQETFFADFRDLILFLTFPLEFKSNQDGKTVMYTECVNDKSFSILHFNDLLGVEFHFRNNTYTCGVRIKWYENEEEVKKAKENYKIVIATKR
ncbi:hypothetical protein PFISCL1PPCAC_19221 [Pristionchus fissidentatus]|uniref:F-box domain-containing protein n=1 Tax=Pristionchus fissidentatus TaxID=1538716 RepID=A0AAV5WDN4_9BILA|nr:hypothetical protein PFISCL1PPCAC_19221 [Pristionchus fissidentatus]